MDMDYRRISEIQVILYNSDRKSLQNDSNEQQGKK